MANVHISVFGKTDVGKTRDHNEDTFLVADLTRKVASLQPDVREHDVGARGTLFMVADGMGGAAAGEVASRMAADVVHRALTEAGPTALQGFPRQMADTYAEQYQLARLWGRLLGRPAVMSRVAGAAVNRPEIDRRARGDRRGDRRR